MNCMCLILKISLTEHGKNYEQHTFEFGGL